MRNAASCSDSVAVSCPVGTFRPAVRTMKSVPKLQFARSCMSLSPLTLLVCSPTAPLGCTRALTKAVPTSKLSDDETGMTTNTGVVNSVIVSFTGDFS